MKASVVTKVTNSPEETMRLGEMFGQQLSGGEVLQLIGDVGVGKTTFVRGLAKGLGSPDHVSSPTFTFYKFYGGGRLPLYHYDFYRMMDDRIVQNELAELATHKRRIIVLEWAERVQSVLPKEHIKIHIEPSTESVRKFSITLPPKNNDIKL